MSVPSCRCPANALDFNLNAGGCLTAGFPESATNRAVDLNDIAIGQSGQRCADPRAPGRAIDRVDQYSPRRPPIFGGSVNDDPEGGHGIATWQ